MRGEEDSGLKSARTRRLRLLARLNFGNGVGGFVVIALIIVTIALLTEASPTEPGFELMMIIVFAPIGWVLHRLYKSTLREENECILEMKSPARFSDILVRLDAGAPKPDYLRRILEEMVGHGAIRNTEDGYVRGASDAE